jgi:hypothetical protein
MGMAPFRDSDRVREVPVIKMGGCHTVAVICDPDFLTRDGQQP